MRLRRKVYVMWQSLVLLLKILGVSLGLVATVIGTKVANGFLWAIGVVLALRLMGIL